MKEHVKYLLSNITAEIFWQNILKFHEKFARKKIMEFLSHVLVMYGCHILINILCIASVRNKQQSFLENQLGVLVCTTDTCIVEY